MTDMTEQERFRHRMKGDFESIRLDRSTRVNDNYVYMHAAEYSAFQLGRIAQLMERLTVAAERIAASHPPVK